MSNETITLRMTTRREIEVEAICRSLLASKRLALRMPKNAPLTKELLEPMFFSLVRSVEVLEKIQDRWRFLLPTDPETWDDMKLDTQMQDHLRSDLGVLIAIRVALPFHFDNHLPSKSEIATQKDMLSAIVEYLASLSFAISHLLGIYTDQPEKKSFWQKIKEWLGFS